MGDQQPYITIRARKPADGNSVSSADSTYGSTVGDNGPKTATHDISRVSYHVKDIKDFAQRLGDSAKRAFPNTGRSSQRYKKVQALLLHWNSDDLFVLPELEDLERCMRDDYAFDTEIFAIPSDNSHLELMLKVGQLIKDHEDTETLFVVYYGGHARIDESRQSTWCATRLPDSPWLQWSAIQTLLERSASDVLILLDCCAGAASATFPNGSSITETISASSWDAIAPDPGRYSFTNALIEVLGEWRLRTFSAAMLHAELLARLKHPRPITINGKHFEARSTPVHFMMTSNHRAPSIEMCRVVPADKRPPSPPNEEEEPIPIVDLAGIEPIETVGAPGEGRSAAAADAQPVSSPTEDTPHVMISLALEDDQRLDLKAWEQWLSAFPALAKFVKVQGVFQSHSTLLLLSMPVMIWDLLPEDHAASFVAFIRSNNLMLEKPSREPEPVKTAVPPLTRRFPVEEDYDMPSGASFFSDTTMTPTVSPSILTQQLRMQGPSQTAEGDWANLRPSQSTFALSQPTTPHRLTSPSTSPLSVYSRPIMRTANSTTSLAALQRQPTSGSLAAENISRTMIFNQQQSSRRTAFTSDAPEPPRFAPHVERRLEAYYEREPLPNDAQKMFVASNLGVEPFHVQAWFHHRRQRDEVSQRLHGLKMDDAATIDARDGGARMILPVHLSSLLEIFSPGQLLLVDVRSPSEFERSHVHGAVNLRVPLRFAERADLTMLERAFADDTSRRTFAAWPAAACVVFYDRRVEVAAHECPVADALLRRFRAARGWEGKAFVLKGHYREFAASYGRYIVGGAQMTQEAKDYVDSLRERQTTAAESRRRFEEWLAQLDSGGGRVQSSNVSPTDQPERARAAEEQQRSLDEEFQRRFPDLARKAAELYYPGEHSYSPVAPGFDGAWAPGVRQRSRDKDKDNFDAKAGFVEYLDRGLTKIRETQPAAGAGTGARSPPPFVEGYSAKLAADASYFDDQHHAAAAPAADRRTSDGFVDVGRADEDDPALLKAGLAAGSAGVAGDETPRRGRGGILNKVFRR